MTIRIVGKNTLSFDDGSKFRIPVLWVTALRDKLKNEALTLESFLSDFDSWTKEHWATKTAFDKFSPALGLSPWDKSTGLREDEAYRSMAELAENELYRYLRGYILGLTLYRMTGSKRGAIILTDRGIIEYPRRKSTRRHARKRN